MDSNRFKTSYEERVKQEKGKLSQFLKITKYTTLTGNYAGSGKKSMSSEEACLVQARPRAYTEMIYEKDEETSKSTSNPSQKNFEKNVVKNIEEVLQEEEV